MQNQKESVISSTLRRGPVSVVERHALLQLEYQQCPEKAWVIDAAKTNSSDIPANEPLYSVVKIESGEPIELPIAVHTAVGGESELPTPGHLLSAAIASCFDSATRMIANRVGLELDVLEVSASLGVDVRGALCIDATVPVGFQDIEIEVNIVAGLNTDEKLIEQVLGAAEHCCVLMQTLRKPPEIKLASTISCG